MRETALIIGATGAQGGSVARHLLGRGRVRVRAATRRPDSAMADALAASGAEVVPMDLDDRASIRQALDGVTRVFGVTSYYEHLDAEVQQGMNLIDEVARSGRRHLVLSTLPSVKHVSGGALTVRHFDNKAALEGHARSLDLRATYVQPAFYFENFLTYFRPRPDADGGFAFGFPQGNAPLAGVSVADLGGVVATLFEEPDRYSGTTVPVVGDELAPVDYAAVMTAELGVPVRYEHVPREVFAAYPFPGAGETAAMFDYYRRFAPRSDDDRRVTRALDPGVRDFVTWTREERNALLGALGPTAAAASS